MTKTEIMKVSTQTPIEIALQIDENGMTTSKKLYEFLELVPSQYSRWCNTNIIKNEFAVENEDYYSTSMSSEQKKGNFAKDYKLTAQFAKKLSMKGNSAKSEQAREYFLAVEQGLKIATAKLQDKTQSNIEVLNALNNITATLSSITDRLTKLETQTNKPTLPIPKYSR